MIARGPVTKGVAQLLALVTERPVGVRTAPIDPTTGRPYPPPYTLLDPLDRVSDDRTLADRHTTAVCDYQATYVSGPTPGVPDSRGGDEQAQWMSDRGWKVIERRTDGAPGYQYPLTIPGVHCDRREAKEAGGTSDPSDAIMTSVIRYRFFLEETGA